MKHLLGDDENVTRCGEFRFGEDDRPDVIDLDEYPVGPARLVAMNSIDCPDCAETLNHEAGEYA